MGAIKLTGKSPEEVSHIIAKMGANGSEANPTRQFKKLDEDRYQLRVPEMGTSLELDRVRWESNSLVGMLKMHCSLPGAKTIHDSMISVAEFNISGPRARLDRAKFLAERTQVPIATYDWVGVFEELCQRTMADQCSAPKAERLADIPTATEADRWIHIGGGLKVLASHSTILFGDGGSAKSYLGLYFGGLIARAGVNVALLDWELDGSSHKERYCRLFGEDMPRNLWYLRQTAPLSRVQDGLKRFVTDNRIGFAIYDSVGYACGGQPETAESAISYAIAKRRVCPGGIHIAHRSKKVKTATSIRLGRFSGTTTRA